MRASLAAAVIAALAIAVARAEPPPVTPVEPPSRIDVAVGETAARDVGIAQGLRCDDTRIAQVALRTVSGDAALGSQDPPHREAVGARRLGPHAVRAAADINRFEVTGVAPGQTMCRVGTVPNRPSFLFEIHVAPSRPPR